MRHFIAGWDLLSLLDNSKTFVQTAGGALLMLIGTVTVIWAGVLIAVKFFSQEHGQKHSWVKMIVAILVGGALAVGGWQLMNTVASGGQQTIIDLGGGVINAVGLLHR